MFKYTHHNGELEKSHINSTVFLKGWVAKKRHLGGLLFIDLRDRFGVTQLVVKPDSPLYEKASEIKAEYVIEVAGKVVERESKNEQLKTGFIEVVLSKLNILSKAETPPITLGEHDHILEDTRLKYRYLDLRRSKQQQYLIKRHEIVQAIRAVLLKESFYELETPILGKSTPEGARDFLVPSRLYPGEFYALPQSPQIYKQLFMVAGFERYFQVARCFRDEDLRADRQLEFTQIDIEASFVETKDIMTITERIISNIFKQVLNRPLKLPLPHITYDEALEKYGSDKPDLRFDLEIKDYTVSFNKFDVPLFNGQPCIKGILTNNDASFTRKVLDQYQMLVKKHHGFALAYVKKENDALSGSIAKFVDPDIIQNGQILFLVPGRKADSLNALGALRVQLGRDLALIDETKDSLVWVTDFDLLEFDAETNRFYARHHPFTAPKDVNELKTDPYHAKANAYDIVWNGYEIGGGSIRIHDQKVQSLMFETLGFSKDEIQDKFGFFVDALKYGTPPHGGIALGLDRIVMLATGTTNIKDVVAFPKTQSARDLMMHAPSAVDAQQLDDLGIKVK